MAKVKIKCEVKIEEEDYQKITEFANKDDSNLDLRDLDKLLASIIEFNIKGILGQIAMHEAKAKEVIAKVDLIGLDGKPLGRG